MNTAEDFIRIAQAQVAVSRALLFHPTEEQLRELLEWCQRVERKCVN